jgi:hypothetical protein
VVAAVNQKQDKNQSEWDATLLVEDRLLKKKQKEGGENNQHPRTPYCPADEISKNDNDDRIRT